MTLDDCLEQLAKACADHLTLREFTKFWNRATATHHDTVAGASPDVYRQRTEQIRFLHKSGGLSKFIQAWIDGIDKPDPELRDAVARYEGYISIDVSRWGNAAGDEAKKQAILAELDAFMQSDDLLKVLQVDFPRVCCIAGTAKLQNGGLPAPKPVGGTGFLVGPDTVLTNWHVIAPLLDDVGSQRPGSESEFAVYFDHKQKQKIDDHTKDWPETVRVAPASDWFVTGSPQSNGAATLDQTLDYALVRLASPIGKAARNRMFGPPRGWIKLPSAAEFEDPKRDARLICPQHPDRSGRVVDFGRAIAKYQAAHTRLAYALSSTNGSSGSPALSTKGQLVALHEADGAGAGAGDPKPAEHNRGILASAFADLARQHLPDVDAEPSAVTGLWAVRRRNVTHPLVGRGKLLKWIDDQIGADPTDPPIYVARGDPKTGKSFSVDILRVRLERTADTVLAFASTAEVAGTQSSTDRVDMLVLPERPDLLLAEVAKALRLDASTIPPAPPETLVLATDLGGGVVNDLKPNDWASKSLTKWLEEEMRKTNPEPGRRLWVSLDIPPNTPFGPAMQSFLKSWTLPVADDHPFARFRWLFIDYEPTFIDPGEKIVDVLIPVQQITAEDVKAFVANAYMAAGRGQPTDEFLNESARFLKVTKKFAPPVAFWEAVVSLLSESMEEYFTSGRPP
jgi:hypothetical protein